MSYTPTTWAAGDTVTAAKLNKLEQGVASGGVLVVNMSLNNDETIGTLDKTWQEIHDADFPVVRFSYQGRVFWYQVLDVGPSDGGYGVTVVMNFRTAATEEFEASTTDGYPSCPF